MSSLLRIASGKENVHDAGHASEEDLIDLKDTVDRHEHAITEDAIQIAALKSQIEDLKDGIRELIDAVEDLATAKRNVEITLEAEDVALKRFGRRIEGLKQHFKTEGEEGI